MSHKEPHQFSSEIPQHLLEKVPAESRWLMENISILSQKTDYLLEVQQQQGLQAEEMDKKLEGIDKKVAYTNGKVAQAIFDIQQLKDKNNINKEHEEHVRQMVETKKFIEKLIFSKFFWIIFGLFIIGSITVFTSIEVKNIFPFLRN